MAVRVTNLTFHGIGSPQSALDPFEKEFWVPRETLEFVLSETSGRDDIRVTFDDGNISDYEQAFPALLDCGMTADFFVCAGLVGKQGHMNQDQLKEMISKGMRIGSHGYDHRSWRNLEDRELNREIEDARSALEDFTGTSVKVAACPFGDYDSRVLKRLKEADFDRVYTSDKGRAWSDHWLQSRNAIRSWHTRDQILRILSPSPSPIREVERRIKTFFKKLR